MTATNAEAAGGRRYPVRVFFGGTEEFADLDEWTREALEGERQVLRQLIGSLPDCARRGCRSPAFVRTSYGTLYCDDHVDVPESMPHLTWEDLPHAGALRALPATMLVRGEK